jgi:hypothetical protein
MIWFKTEEIKPQNNKDCLIYVLYAGDEEFTIEIDQWQGDCFYENGGFWLNIEDHCQFVETVADGPGFCNRPIVSHWMPLPIKPD